MSGKERIKQYFEEAIKTDEALKNAYDEKKLNDCWDYITKQAKKAATGNCACIEDAEVFKWARDFMYGDIAKDNANGNDNNIQKQSENKSDVPEESKTSEQNGQGAQTTEEVESADIKPQNEKHEITVDGETTKDDFVVVSDGEIKHRCNECGYIHISEPCHQDEGICLFKRNNGFADNVVKLQSIACSQFIKLATDDDIKPIKEKLQIEKVEEEHAEETQPVVQEYKQPSLFDDLF